MNKNQRGFTLVEVTFLLLWIVGICGWVANIVKIVESIDGGITAMFVIRIVGIFAAPLGAVLGFI